MGGEEEIVQELSKLSHEDRVKLEQEWRSDVERNEELKRQSEERAQMYEKWLDKNE